MGRGRLWHSGEISKLTGCAGDIESSCTRARRTLCSRSNLFMPETPLWTMSHRKVISNPLKHLPRSMAAGRSAIDWLAHTGHCSARETYLDHLLNRPADHFVANHWQTCSKGMFETALNSTCNAAGQPTVKAYPQAPDRPAEHTVGPRRRRHCNRNRGTGRGLAASCSVQS